MGMFLLFFISLSGVMMSMGFISFLIRDPEYYNIGDVGKVTGDLGLYSELVMLVFDLGFGFVIDKMGRKVPLVLGTLSAGVALGLMPMFHTVYP